jgi:hypothetical protein
MHLLLVMSQPSVNEIGRRKSLRQQQNFQLKISTSKSSQKV